MLYKSKEEGNANAFINNYQLEDGKKLSKSNFNEFFMLPYTQNLIWFRSPFHKATCALREL